MKALLLFAFLFVGLVHPAFGAEEPCAADAQRLFQTIAGDAPITFGLSSSQFNAWADAMEYVYIASAGPGSAYAMEYFHLDERQCFLYSVRFLGDL